MATNPITTPLPADLPTNWAYGQTVGPDGTAVGLSEQHGYNYLMEQVNAAQEAANTLGEAFEGVADGNENGDALNALALGGLTAFRELQLASIPPEAIPNETDFNTLRTPGEYYSSTSHANRLTYINTPGDLLNFKLTVEEISSNGGIASVVQTIQTVREEIFRRIGYNDGQTFVFTQWEQMATPSLNANLTLYVSPSGSDTAGDGSEGSPYATIQHAIDTIPKNLGGYSVIVNLAPGTYNEDVTIIGFSGSDNQGIQLIGGSSLDEADQYIISGEVKHIGSASHFKLQGVTADMVTLQGGFNSLVYVKSTASTSYGAQISYGATAGLFSSEFSNKTIAGVYAVYGSVVSVRNVSGTGNAVGLMAGSSISTSCGIIMKGTGVTITGTTQESIYRGSRIFGELSDVTGSGTWTPVGANCTISDVEYATWYRNGNHITAAAKFTLAPGESGSISINGLPFQAAQLGFATFPQWQIPMQDSVKGISARVFAGSRGMDLYAWNPNRNYNLQPGWFTSTTGGGVEMVVEYIAQ